MKPRSDSKLMSLPEEQIAQIAEWLISNQPYHQVKKLIKEQFNVDTSLASLSNFYQSICVQELHARRQRAVTTADQIAEEAQKKPGNFDAATIDALKQKAFELAVSTRADPRDVKSLFMLVLKARDQELQEKDVEIKIRRLEMLESQLREARERLTRQDGTKVDPKMLADEIDRILGRKS